MDARVPFSAYRCEVLPQWVDRNGHMNVAYYVLAFDRATQAFLDNINLGSSYVEQNACSIHVVDMNVTYKRELDAGVVLHIDTQLLEFNDKKLRIIHQMFLQSDGALVATNEVLLEHMSIDTGKSCEFPELIFQRLEQVSEYHFSLEQPENAGRVLSLS